MQEFITRIGTLMACFALTITTINVNSACMMFLHQPKLPDGATKLRKF